MVPREAYHNLHRIYIIVSTQELHSWFYTGPIVKARKAVEESLELDKGKDLDTGQKKRQPSQR